MNMRERLVELEAARQRSARIQASAGAGMERRRKTAEREERLRVRREERIAQDLSEEDRVVALLFRLPKKRQERVEAAKSLRVTASGRTRTHREIAAIMGVHEMTVHKLLMYDTPEKWAEHWRATTKGKTPKKKTTPPPPPPPPLAPEEPPHVEPFGVRLHRVRRRANVSQAKLAELSAIPREQISAWERGETPDPPTPSVSQALSRALGAPI